MSAPRFGRLQRASALVPLALLSAAWTASLAGVGMSTASAGENPAQTLPDGTSVPTEAIEAPASVSTPGVVAPGIDGNVDDVVATSSTSGIPAAALAAYQRAETVINAADKSCNLSWQLVAAIGRVESDHGRVNGNSLNSEGLATPGIFGIALDGSNNTARIADSDAGLYDNDTKYDRAVGPMQFIPSTWSVVGVDADGDARRDPQDIDDAALASAVYLCSGKDDLATETGQRASVFRYNHSVAYVDLVLSIMNAYLAGDFTSVPNSTTSAGYFIPDPNPPAQVRNTGGNGGNGPGNGGGSGGGGAGGGGGGGSDPVPPPEDEPDPIETPEQGTDNLPVETPNLPAPSPTSDPEDVLTTAEATEQCLKQGVVDNPLTPQTNELQDCIEGLTS